MKLRFCFLIAQATSQAIGADDELPPGYPPMPAGWQDGDPVPSQQDVFSSSPDEAGSEVEEPSDDGGGVPIPTAEELGGGEAGVPMQANDEQDPAESDDGGAPLPEAQEEDDAPQDQGEQDLPDVPQQAPVDGGLQALDAQGGQISDQQDAQGASGDFVPAPAAPMIPGGNFPARALGWNQWNSPPNFHPQRSTEPAAPGFSVQTPATYQGQRRFLRYPSPSGPFAAAPRAEDVPTATSPAAQAPNRLQQLNGIPSDLDSPAARVVLPGRPQFTEANQQLTVSTPVVTTTTTTTIAGTDQVAGLSMPSAPTFTWPAATNAAPAEVATVAPPELPTAPPLNYNQKYGYGPAAPINRFPGANAYAPRWSVSFSDNAAAYPPAYAGYPAGPQEGGDAEPAQFQGVPSFGLLQTSQKTATMRSQWDPMQAKAYNAALKKFFAAEDAARVASEKQMRASLQQAAARLAARDQAVAKQVGAIRDRAESLITQLFMTAKEERAERESSDIALRNAIQQLNRMTHSSLHSAISTLQKGRDEVMGRAFAMFSQREKEQVAREIRKLDDARSRQMTHAMLQGKAEVERSLRQALMQEEGEVQALVRDGGARAVPAEREAPAEEGDSQDDVEPRQHQSLGLLDVSPPRSHRLRRHRQSEDEEAEVQNMLSHSVFAD